MLGGNVPGQPVYNTNCQEEQERKKGKYIQIQYSLGVKHITMIILIFLVTHLTFLYFRTKF